MDYLIGDKVYFCTGSSSLRDAETGDELHLPPSAAFILMMLITHQGNTVSRDSFFDAAWRDYGYKLSGNTLSQHISLLRKHFERLGLQENIITTVPRNGFYLEGSVTVKAMSPNPVQIVEPAQPQTRHRRLRKTLLLSLSILFVLIQFIWLMLADHTDFTFTPALLGRLGKCEVYSSHSLSESYSDKAMQIATDVAKNYLPCRSNEAYLFDIGGGLLFHNNGRVFLSRCDKSSDGASFSGCQDILIYEMRQESGDHL